MVKMATGRHISTHALARLQGQMEGWAAGLRLLILTGCGFEKPQAMVDGLWACGNHIGEYLVQEALEAQPALTQEWLLKSAIPKRFSVDVCTAVCAPGPAGGVNGPER